MTGVASGCFVERQVLTYVTILLILATPLATSLEAQNLDDFARAAASDGVNVIPFPDLRSTAEAIAREVESAKGEAGRHNYSLLERQKANTLGEITKAKQAIAGKEREIQDFKRENPNGSSSALEADLERLEETLSDLQDDVEEFNEDELADALSAFRRLADARNRLRVTFEKVLTELKDARSSPDEFLGANPAVEDVDKLKRYIDIIEDEIEANARSHRDQEEGAAGMVEKISTLIAKNAT